MEINDVTRNENKSVVMTVRTTKQISEFMKKNNISPSKVFDKAIREIIDKHKEKK